MNEGPIEPDRTLSAVIYYTALGTDLFYMMVAYPKSERDDLSTEQRRRILAALESIKKSGS